MSRTRLGTILCAGLFLAAALSGAQTKKAGLWDVTSNMTWQQSPFPAGMGGGANSPFGGGSQTTAVCLTQEQIDKFGAPTGATHRDCQIVNVVVKPNGMTADMVCGGRMGGKGTIRSTWTDDDHAVGKVHFMGSIQAGPTTKPVEWTIDSTSVFKSADCGNVKPIASSSK